MRGQISLELPSEPQTVSLCRRVLRSLLVDLEVDESRVADIEVVISEATGNVVRHAYADVGHPYRVVLTFFSNRVRLEVTDRGIGFARADVPDPDEERLGGRGLWLIEQLADVTTVSMLPGGGCRLEAEFFLSGPLPLPAVAAGNCADFAWPALEPPPVAGP